MATPGQPFLEARGLSKRFGLTQALSNVSLSFERGEVHALMGENGAGKSTLGKIIAGLHAADAGSVLLDGRALPPGDIHAAYAAGVRIVHQELAQCPNLSVAENLCLHDMPRRAWGFVNRRAMEDRAARLLHELEPAIDVRAPLGDLSLGWRQMCQIAGALDRGPDGRTLARAIVFDEPTSSLTAGEVERLLVILRRLAAEGITIIYVSHRMAEVFEVCDRVTVLRDGAYVATTRTPDLTEPMLVDQMIGRHIEQAEARPAFDMNASQPILSVRGLSSPGKLHDISLDLRPGEILGIGGLIGAGRSELLDAIFGLDAKAVGTITVSGRHLAGGVSGHGHHRGSNAAIAAGLGYVPEDRRRQGLFFDLGVDENIVLPRMSEHGVLGIRRISREHRDTSERVASFAVKAESLASKPAQLSGGNQQKLLLARWMNPATKVLLLDEPTRGIDIGTKSEIHRRVREAAAAGTAVLVVSSEMPELLGLSGRVIVMRGGKVAATLIGPCFVQADVLRHAASPTV